MGKFYLVTTKCGHVGKHLYMPITFPVYAESKKDAARIARCKARVKHDHWDAILDVTEVSLEEFLEQKEINSNDLYLTCSSRHEQDSFYSYIEDRLVYDSHQDEMELKRLRKHSRKPNYKFIGMKYGYFNNAY